MIKLLVFTIFISLTLSTNSVSSEDVLIEKGFRLPDTSVVKNFRLMKAPLEEKALVKHIIATNYKVSRRDAEDIAYYILKASICFQVDPWMLTALIQKESSFMKDAISPTGAAGLTQFTTAGLKEVNDQLGLRGNQEADKTAIDYFNGQLLECMDPVWVDLWTKIGLPEEDPKFYVEIKEILKEEIPTALSYGAILLKTYVAHIDGKAARTETPISLSETYFQALQIYNGEEGDAKVKYAKAVFKNMRAFYPKEVTFPFLAD